MKKRNPDIYSPWEEQIKSIKVGECQGHMVSFLGGCQLFASLRRVYIAGRSYYLCGRCIAKIKLIKRMKQGFPVSKKEIKRYKRDRY